MRINQFKPYAAVVKDTTRWCRRKFWSTGELRENNKYRCNRPEYTPGRSIPGCSMA